MRLTRKFLAGMAGLMLTTTACNHTPVESLEKSFTFRVDKRTGDEEPVKVDFLWVIDNSTSMCQEQASLASNFQKFVNQLQSSFDLDVRVATTGVDVQCSPDDTNNPLAHLVKGRFNTKPARSFGLQCVEHFSAVCSGNASCATEVCDNYPPGECPFDASTGWQCGNTSLVGTCGYTTENDSIITTCRPNCTASYRLESDGRTITRTEDSCWESFGPDYICQRETSLTPSSFTSGDTLNNATGFGCLRQAETQACPDDIGAPGYLTNDNLNLFPCIATVGMHDKHCMVYEQPLQAGLLALDPTGPNRTQAENFLRDDAYLVIVFVTDEEDCSVPYDNATNAEMAGYAFDRDRNDEVAQCGLAATTDNGGKLRPVGYFVNRFKALKRDPGRVIVAAIAGDSTAEGAAKEADRQSYIESRLVPRCGSETSICNSAFGSADYAGRLVQLTEAFGPNGSFSNICDAAGIEPALTQIANTILTVIGKVCLPHPILDGLVVKRYDKDGNETVLREGDGPGTYAIVRGAEDCAVDGTIMPAIYVNDPPAPGDRFEVTYQGDPQFN